MFSRFSLQGNPCTENPYLNMSANTNNAYVVQGSQVLDWEETPFLTDRIYNEKNYNTNTNNAQDEGYGFSVRGDAPVVVAGVELNSLADVRSYHGINHHQQEEEDEED